MTIVELAIHYCWPVVGRSTGRVPRAASVPQPITDPLPKKSGPQNLRAARVLQTTNLEEELRLQLNRSRSADWAGRDDAGVVRQRQALMVIDVEDLGFKVEHQVSPEWR